MIEYIEYLTITIILSTIFAMAGLGSAIALVPTLNIVGLSFDISRVMGLFVNFITTITTSFINFKKRLFDMNFVFPLVVSSMIFAFFGAKISLITDTIIVKTIFGYTLIILASMILFIKIKPKNNNNKYDKKILIISGAIGGFFSGFLGIGGGSIISPLLILYGYNPKNIAIGISFVIPFSSLIAFGSYISVVDIDYILLAIVGFGAIIGGVIGNYLLHFKISSQTIKKILAVVLYILAFKILAF
jgi:uncharacterized membrane protein YfcA